MKMLRKEKQKQGRQQQFSAGQSYMTEFDRETVTRSSDRETFQVKNETKSFSGHSLMSDIDHRGESSSKDGGHGTKKKPNKSQDAQDVSREPEPTKPSPGRFRERHYRQFRLVC